LSKRVYQGEVFVINFRSVPIFIVSYNRLSCLQLLIAKLEKDGYTNLIIVDNASTNKSLLDYLQSLPYKVHFLEKNYGHLVLWESRLFEDIINSTYYVLTDPDVIPIDECPSDYVEHFYDILKLYPEKTKVGFSLKIDDLPEHNPNKYDLIRWESFFYENKLSQKPLYYDADVDTTFALYRPGYPKHFYNAIRTGFPYTARHLGWYTDTENLSDEDELYFKSANSSFSSYDDSAISQIRNSTIKKIAEKQENFSLYKLIKRVIKLERLTNTTFGEIFRITFFLLSKKIRQHYKCVRRKGIIQK
jgi:hypothetical protein